MSSDSKDDVKEFILSILSSSSYRLETLSVSIIRQKIAEHFGPEDFGDFVVDIVDQWLTGVARESNVLGVTVREALKRGLADVRASGRSVTVKKKTAQGIISLLETSKTGNVARRHKGDSPENGRKKLTLEKSSSSQIQETRKRGDLIEKDDNQNGNNEHNRKRTSEEKVTERKEKKKKKEEKKRSKDEKQEGHRRALRKKERLECDSDDSEDDGEEDEAMILGLDDQYHDDDHEEDKTLDEDSGEPPRKKKRSGDRPVLHVDKLLIDFTDGEQTLKPREYAEHIINYCQEQHLELIKGKMYKTDATLRKLFKDKGHISKFPAKIVEALKQARMLTYWHYG